MIFDRFFNRQLWVLVHRYAGLYMAFILIVAGLTGSILAFDAELQEWLNPEDSQTVAVQLVPMLDPFTLRERALKLEPRARINFVPLNRRSPGEIYAAFLTPRTDPTTRQPFNLPPVRLNPYTGERLANPPEPSEPDNPYWPISRQNFIGLVLGLHYTLLLGDLGRWLFGIAAATWTLDCFVGFYLTLPVRRKSPQTLSAGMSPEPPCNAAADLGLPDSAPGRAQSNNTKSFWQRWQVAWKVKWPSSTQRLNFDLHRAGGLWTWPLLFIFAWSSVRLNLGHEVYYPVVNFLFHPAETEEIPELPSPRPDPAIGFRDAHTIGKRLMAQLALEKHVNLLGEYALSYEPTTGLYQYRVRSDWDITGQLAMTGVFFDGNTGALITSSMAKDKPLSDSFSDWILFLHRKWVWGLPWQIVNCLMGLVTAMLSVTGVYLWWVKRRASKVGRVSGSIA